MTQVTALFELYKNLARSDKNEFVKLIEIEGTGSIEAKEIKRQRRLRLMEECEAFFVPLRKGLPTDYKFSREFANEK